MNLQPLVLSDDDLARLYDDSVQWWGPFASLLLEQVPMSGVSDVVDVGAGTGFAAVELARRFGAATTVHAVDPWEPALALCAARAARAGVANVVPVAGAIESVAVPPAGLVVCSLGVNNFDDPAGALAACRRATAPGGTFALTTNVVGHMAELYDALASALAAEGLPLDELEAHIAHRGTRTSVSELVEDAGFTVRRSVKRTLLLRYASANAFLSDRFIRMAFLPAWLATVPKPAHAVVFADVEARLGPSPLTLTIPALYLEATLV